MKSLLAVVSLIALGGCAVAPGPVYYQSRSTQAYDPYQWHTVSSEPTSGPAGYAAPIEYSSVPVYAPQPVYVQRPVYVQQPYYYTPPVTIGLDLMFGWRGGRHGGHHHHHGRR
ncbi:hypothetical protein [Janthinobacterium fluminis]|uniref:Lipoprotein n=1 Tax=Janthinobacterium fluminis TaxID=2987524 RepID=A0ABT5K0K1_9BURK|nr:hypothetical protein [Janthinobacterium fluminis]MDC8757287.1 hypothetical protein [Janthinobacterium fluminis]